MGGSWSLMTLPLRPPGQRVQGGNQFGTLDAVLVVHTRMAQGDGLGRGGSTSCPCRDRRIRRQTPSVPYGRTYHSADRDSGTTPRHDSNARPRGRLSRPSWPSTFISRTLRRLAKGRTAK